MFRNSPKMMVVLVGITLCFWMASCAPKDIGIKIEGGVPIDRLRYYDDSFDALKRDLWEVAAFSQTDQLRNFEMADVNYENSRVRVNTRSGAFSGAVFTSKYQLRGDFDIQIDCEMQFLKGKVTVDQLLYFAVVKKGETFYSGGSVSNVISKPSGLEDGFIGVVLRQHGKYTQGNFNKISGFTGTIRLLRTGDQIKIVYHKQSANSWSKLDRLSFTIDDVAIVFGVQNFRPGRKDLNASESVTAYFDNFRINAAVKVIEDEI
jgi:hypothetical protein